MGGMKCYYESKTVNGNTSKKVVLYHSLSHHKLWLFSKDKWKSDKNISLWIYAKIPHAVQTCPRLRNVTA